MSDTSAFNTRLSRRGFHQVVAGAGLSYWLPSLSARAANCRGPERARTLITIWLEGGPSQLETWDPHPGTAIGGTTQAIGTTLPGVSIAAHYPQVAEQLQHLSVLRSLVSKEGDHERAAYFMKTGYRLDPTVVHPSVGAIITSRLADPQFAIPSHVALGGGGRFPRGGYLGERFDAFRVPDPGGALHNMKSRVSPTRQERRLDGLSVATQTFLNRYPSAGPGNDQQETFQRALTAMSAEQLHAFEIDKEPAEVRAAYGNSRFGRGCLVARRLVEIGVRAIEVSLSGFDGHVDNFELHATRARDLDPALATLVRELIERDLFQSTILLCVGEFGRTPSINPLEGRDHWPNGFSALVGGGGLVSGVVIGATDPSGKAKVPTDPVPAEDLWATILAQLGIAADEEVITPIGRPLAICEGTPIERLLRH